MTCTTILLVCIDYKASRLLEYEVKKANISK
jgi:hypothetical protein